MEFAVRGYYIADDGCIILNADYDSQEYKMLGHYSNDENFMQFIHEGKDVHIATGSLLKEVPYDIIAEEVRKQGLDLPYDSDIANIRQQGKTGNFATVYGIGNPGIANSMGYSIDEQRLRGGTKYLYEKFRAWKMPPYSDAVTLEQMLAGVTDPAIIDGIKYFMSEDVQKGLKAAADFKKKYFGQFPNIKGFLKDASSAAASRGYVKTWTGRRRHFKDPQKESYKAPNAIIQGGCGDICKVKLKELTVFLRPYKTRIVNTVHDSIMFSMPYDEVGLIPEIKRILEDLPFRVPITCSMEWGFSWGALKNYTGLDDLRRELGAA
jgi:DNA polymerase I-like protein with 3'-5' exonuclease and polymerase domains